MPKRTKPRGAVGNLRLVQTYAVQALGLDALDERGLAGIDPLEERQEAWPVDLDYLKQSVGTGNVWFRHDDLRKAGAPVCRPGR